MKKLVMTLGLAISLFACTKNTQPLEKSESGNNQPTFQNDSVHRCNLQSIVCFSGEPILIPSKKKKDFTGTMASTSTGGAIMIGGGKKQDFATSGGGTGVTGTTLGGKKSDMYSFNNVQPFKS